MEDDLLKEDDLVPISALQHMLFCPRQCALIHNEQLWAENALTVEGRILHERSDSGVRERRGKLKIERSVPLRSLRLGVSGIADVIEIYNKTCFYPVEYKRGRPKAHRADEVQLCAQALCLEEMLNVQVPEGSLFYGQNRRRTKVRFDAELRYLTEKIATETRVLLSSGITPLPIYEATKCESCSLKELCQPRKSFTSGAVEKWVTKYIEE